MVVTHAKVQERTVVAGLGPSPKGEEGAAVIGRDEYCTSPVDCAVLEQAAQFPPRLRVARRSAGAQCGFALSETRVTQSGWCRHVMSGGDRRAS